LRLKIIKKLRTASINSEFTGSYKKSVVGSVSINRLSADKIDRDALYKNAEKTLAKTMRCMQHCLSYASYQILLDYSQSSKLYFLRLLIKGIASKLVNLITTLIY